ncbi:MAG TPA: cytochrome c [bacterium]|nr:cytochrome c [bacterium]
MKKALMALGAAVLGAAVLAGCATTGVPAPSADLVARAQARWPGTTARDLAAGRRLYAANCAACHELHDASDLSPVGWEKIMAKMQKKAHIDDLTKESILKYLESATERTDGRD